MENFSFVVPGVVAGGAWPNGTAKQLSQEFQRLGIRSVVNLTEVSHPEASELSEKFNIHCHHIPIRDFDAPTLPQMQQAAALVMDETQRPIMFHCRRGIGRTGTMLAVAVDQLRHAGQLEPFADGGDAVSFVRTIRPRSLEVAKQLEASKQFTESLR